MLTLFHPEAISLIHEVPIGLIPLSFDGDDSPTLVVKAPKEVILASKLNNGFKIYVVPIELEGCKTLGLISAFFDDYDEPLVIYSPLFKEPSIDIHMELLLSDKVNIYFFDDNSREYLGYSASINCSPENKKFLNDSNFVPYSLSFARKSHDQLKKWFSLRSIEDDNSAISILFSEPLFPEDIVIYDLDPENHAYHGSKSSSHTELVRKEPGSYQEQDIAKLFHRLFLPEEIYINPLRINDKEEIVDILIATEKNIILVQAKDSPNMESILKNKISRKKSTATKSLKKAVKQMQGALGYIGSESSIKMVIGDKCREVEIGERKIRTLVVVKELFDDEYSSYSSIILPLVKLLKVPCIALDYSELNIYTSNLADENSFIEAYDKVSDYGIQSGEFPRLRILPDF